MTEIKAIEALAEVWQVKSMSDLSYNVTFKFDEYMLPQVQWLMAHLHDLVKMVIEVDNKKPGD